MYGANYLVRYWIQQTPIIIRFRYVVESEVPCKFTKLKENLHISFIFKDTILL